MTIAFARWTGRVVDLNRIGEVLTTLTVALRSWHGQIGGERVDGDRAVDELLLLVPSASVAATVAVLDKDPATVGVTVIVTVARRLWQSGRGCS